MLKRFAICVILVLALYSASAASDVQWMRVDERRDFKVGNTEDVMENAYEELRNVYGDEMDTESFRKNRYYIHSLRSDEYKEDVIVVMIEDRSAGDPDCYYEIIFEMPDMNDLSVGGLWLDMPVSDYLNTVIPSYYGPEDVSGDITGTGDGETGSE
ncbi:MAG: hypothetical protein LBS53_15345 [Synergistaceae bacterium]|jgi:hypothetical protein|nr:hypothetical protein [Synergistaceae bacterium]